MPGIFCFVNGRVQDYYRSAIVAFLTVAVGSAALAQSNTRITRSDTNIDNLNRLLNDRDMPGAGTNVRSQSYLNPPPQVDLTKVDQRALANLMKEAVDESTRLYRLLDTDYQRNPQLRPLVQQLLQLRAQAARLNQDLTDRVPLQEILVSFQTLDSDWRLLSHRLAQTPQLSTATRDSIDRIDRIDREVGKMFKVDPTLDRTMLMTQLATMHNAFRNLLDELQLDPTGGAASAQLVIDVRKVQQQIGRVEQQVLDNTQYELIVNEYSRFSRMWTTLLGQLRKVNNRYVERQVRYLADADNAIQQNLWLENKSDKTQLRQTTVALMRDVDEFYNRTPLKLLLNVSNVDRAMQTANDFYGTVQNFQDLIDRNQTDAQILESYQYVEEYGYAFIRTFEAMNSQAARVVLREIEDGIASLRSELNLAGTVSQVDYRQLLPIAASLENLADHLDFDVQYWLNSDRQAFRAEALQASKVFTARTRRLHLLVQGQPTIQELQRETTALYDDWRKIYQYLSYCRTNDRTNLAQLASEIRKAIYDLSAPLQL